MIERMKTLGTGRYGIGTARYDPGEGRVSVIIRRSLRCALAGFMIVAPSLPARLAAQTMDCASLRARIDAIGNSRGRGGQYASALRQQQYELQRTQTYSASIGCSSNFIFSTGPAECDAIASRIERMQDNIGQLQQQIQGGGDEDYRRRALSEQYNAYCSGEASPDPQLMPVEPEAPVVDDDGTSQDRAPQSRGRVRALCVRKCDGGYFPITDDASSNSIEQFDQLCKALCPNTEASLYTVAPSGGIDTAVASDGTPYTSLPAAFRFQKSYDATCSCKPPHQSWVEALANAEKLIESHKGDVTVTQQMSNAMVRPVAPTAADAAPAAKPARKVKVARKKAPVEATLPGFAAQDQAVIPGLSGEDITQQLRRDAPML